MAEVVNQGDGPSWIWAFNERDGHPWLNQPFLQNATVPASASRFRGTRGQPLQVPASLNFPAWVAWPRDLNPRLANGVGVTDAHRFLAQAVDGEIFSESAGTNLLLLQFSLPGRVVFGSIQKYSLDKCSVMPGVGLLVSLEMRCVQPAWPGVWYAEERCFPCLLHPVLRTCLAICAWCAYLY